MKKEILSLAGFIVFALRNEGKISRNVLTETLVHDIMGLAKKIKQGDKFFSPRSSGYEKYL